MRLAILVHAIGEGTYAPVFHLDDLAAELLDDALSSGWSDSSTCCCADPDARDKHAHKDGMDVLSSVGAVPAASPSNLSGKDSKAQKAEARDDGPTGPATSTSPKGEIAETVRSAPGRDPRKARFIRILRAEWQGENRRECQSRARPARRGRRIARLAATWQARACLAAQLLVYFRANSTGGAEMTAAFAVSGAGLPGGRHGQGAGRGLSGGPGGVRRGRCGARREAHRP